MTCINLKSKKMASSFGFASCMRGYHVYQEIWTTTEGETLLCNKETRSREDPFAVAVMKSREIVGHVPRSLSCVCSMFLQRGGSMACRITGGRQHSKDLPQGGLEVLSTYLPDLVTLWTKHNSALQN